MEPISSKIDLPKNACSSSNHFVSSISPNSALPPKLTNQNNNDNNTTNKHNKKLSQIDDIMEEMIRTSFEISEQQVFRKIDLRNYHFEKICVFLFLTRRNENQKRKEKEENDSRDLR